MKFKVGKRYSWTSYWRGGKKYNGLLESISADGKGYFVTKNNDLWEIPLTAPNLKPYEKKKKGK